MANLLHQLKSLFKPSKKLSKEEFYLSSDQLQEEIQLAAKSNDSAHIGFLKGMLKDD